MFIKNVFENAWLRGASPLDPPMPALMTVSLTTTPTSRFGFSMVQGKFCLSCFEITARTALAQFGHLTLKTRVRFQKEGLTPKPPLGAFKILLVGQALIHTKMVSEPLMLGMQSMTVLNVELN